MTREFDIEPVRTYATKAGVRKAIAKTGDEGLRHTILLGEDGRWFAVFIPSEDDMSRTGIHFRWNCLR